MRYLFSKTFLTFMLMGGIAALVNFASRILYSQWMSFSTAIILSYITAMITAFVLMNMYVFQGSHKMHHAMGIFVLINLAAIIQVWLVSMGLDLYVLPWLGITDFTSEISHGIGIMIPIVTSYFGHKYITFRQA